MKCLSAAESEASLATSFQRISLSRPISAIGDTGGLCIASGSGCRFKRKFWRQDIKPQNHVLQGRSFANLTTLKYTSKKEPPIFGRSLASGRRLSKSFPHDLASPKFEAAEPKRILGEADKKSVDTMRTEVTSGSSKNLPSNSTQYGNESESHKSPSKTRTYVKANGRRPPHIKPASHFTERRSYEHVTQVAHQNQFMVPRRARSSPMTSQFSKSAEVVDPRRKVDQVDQSKGGQEHPEPSTTKSNAMPNLRMLRLDAAVPKMVTDASSKSGGDFSVVIPPRTSFRLASASTAAGKIYRNSIHLHDLQITVIDSNKKNPSIESKLISSQTKSETKASDLHPNLAPKSNLQSNLGPKANPTLYLSQKSNLAPKLDLNSNLKPTPQSSRLNSNDVTNQLKPEVGSKNKEGKNLIKSSDTKPVVAKFNLSEKVSHPVLPTSNNGQFKNGYFTNNLEMSAALRPFTVDSVKTFIDADSIIDYGSLATTQPIDVDEALGALDSLKFGRKDTRMSNHKMVTNSNMRREIDVDALKESVARKEAETKLWRKKDVLELKIVQRCNGEVVEKPILPTIIPKMTSGKGLSPEPSPELSQNFDSDGTSQVEVEIVKGSEVSDTDDVISGLDGEWCSGWTSPLTAGTSSDGNLDEEDGFKTGNSTADSEEEITWKASDDQSMEWTSVNGPAEGMSPSVKIRGSLKTVWADDEDSASIASTDNRAKQRAKLNSWLVRSKFLVRQETEDLYCDDELHSSLENDPNMQLTIAGQHAEQVKPYPPMPMLTDRDSILSFDDASTGPTSLRSEFSEEKS